MTTPITELNGMTEAIAEKLKLKGVKTNEQYLEISADPKQRRELAKELGIDAKEVLDLANRADLARVKGVSGVYSELIDRAGVETVKELAHRVPEHLHSKLLEVNEGTKLTGRVPTTGEVEKWIQQAKELPKILTY
ncbi:MAG: DUF4332 domain-containing protein [Gammaproteobacteria bacterium]|nr:DUF4332 domain-containing protein [Gammaproteobacteria bacterium]MBU1655329.1 DUF4332 domain-containing protein [Gammaproteobacteria bacterium]MBU1960992.1 DUF4332 domain-containing protein [Gammaproteobacteria bacterium]